MACLRPFICITAALVAIFGKIGVKGVDSVVASGIRAGIMFIVIFAVVALTGELPAMMSIDQNSLLYIGLGGAAGAASWFFISSHYNQGRLPLLHP